jgi:hypothetical protein
MKSFKISRALSFHYNLIVFVFSQGALANRMSYFFGRPDRLDRDLNSIRGTTKVDRIEPFELLV